MALRSETAALLAGFEKRMKFINIVRFLLEYKYPDAIRAQIPDKKVLDNLILAALLFIKDRTLGSEQRCTMADMQRFLEDIEEILPENCHIDPPFLAHYILVDVLQNGGVISEFLTYDSVRASFRMMSVRLLNEENASYHLTDDAFDFLFRSKEIESELDYSVTRFKMKEYMKRSNYENALEASRELVSRILNMKNSMDDFLLRCRENIANITVDQYESVITRIRSLLESEYTELRDIQITAKERERNLEKAVESGVAREDTVQQCRALQEIVRNISRTIDEQRILINKKDSLSDSYQMLLQDSFARNRYERLNFEEDILAPLRKKGAPLGDASRFLLFMLAKPALENQFSIENFYAPQASVRPEENDAGIDLTQEDSEELQLMEQRNHRNKIIVQNFFAYAKDRTHFTLSEFVGTLRMQELSFFCEENALPHILLSICSLQSMDLHAWKKETSFSTRPNGEFELDWCLEELPDELLQLHSMTFQRLETEFHYSVQMGERQYRIAMSDFDVEVVHG